MTQMGTLFCQTDDIKELSIALAKAQGEMPAVTKDAVNPFFKSKYATLEASIETVSPFLSKHGLSFMSIPSQDAGKPVLIGRLMHSSGQWIQGWMSLVVSKNDMQGLASAITYARRYLFQCMVGIATEDDDGNEAVKQAAPTQTKSTPAPQPAVKMPANVQARINQTPAKQAPTRGPNQPPPFDKDESFPF